MKDPYIKLAREVVENYIEFGKIIDLDVDKLPSQLLNQRAGIFVSIYKKDKDNISLRGCIGTFLPTQKNIVFEIIKNAIAAATKDNRFSRVSKNELPNLSYSIDILTPPQPIRNTQELDPKKYGVIVKSEDGKTGLLLPDLSGVDQKEQQIAIACSKAGIDPTSDSIEIFRFTVDRHKE
jgi:AmmeMemoRadiSam system protein A